MEKKYRKQTDSFIGTAADGRQYRIIEHTWFMQISAIGQPDIEIPGLKEYKDSNGNHVNRVDDTNFTVFDVWSEVPVRKK